MGLIHIISNLEQGNSTLITPPKKNTYRHFININLEKYQVCVLLAQFNKNWRHNTAWSTPGGCEIHHNLLTYQNHYLSSFTCLQDILQLHSQALCQRERLITTSCSCGSWWWPTVRGVMDRQTSEKERKKEKALTTFPACLASWILLSHTALLTTPSTAPWSPAIVSGVSGYQTTAQHRAYQIPAISNKRHTLWQNIRYALTNCFRHAWLTILQTLATGSVWPETLFHDKLLQKQKFKVRCNPCWW